MANDLPSTGNIAKAARDVIETIDQLVALPKKIRDSYRELQLDGVISKINERLHGRYLLIHALERFGQMQGLQQDFIAITETVRERARYLEQFNKKIEARLNVLPPKLAADLMTMTKESIKYYDWLANIESADEMAEIASNLVPWLKEIAAYLEQVNEKLEEKLAESPASS